MKQLKINTVNNIQEQLELPEDKYGLLVEILNVNSIYIPENETEVYKTLEAGEIVVNSVNYSDSTSVIDTELFTGRILAYELDPLSVITIPGVRPIVDVKAFGLVAIIDSNDINAIRVTSIKLVEVDGVFKADVIISPLLPLSNPNVDENDTNLFKLSFIPFTKYVNQNYIIRHDANSLKSILATYMLLSNRNDINDITLTDSNELWVDDCSKVLIIIDSNGNISIDGSAWTNTLDVIKNMCDVYNLQFVATDLMIEIDSIIRNVDGYDTITKIITEVISTPEGKAGFIENTIPLVSNGMYKTFTNFFSSEMVEINIKKKIAKEILNASQVAHSDSYTVNIISSNILLEEIVEAICVRELEHPTTEHVYAIVSNYTDYTDLISICFNSAGLLNNFENNIDVDFGNIIDIPTLVDLTTVVNNVIERVIKTSDVTVEVKTHTLTPMYCN